MMHIWRGFGGVAWACLTVSIVGPARGENLARSGTASQSSDYNTSAVAGKAIDGNRDGVFNNGSVTHTTQPGADGEWWTVNLGATKMVDSVTLWNRSDCCGDRMSNLRISLLDSASNEVYGVDIPNSNPVAQGGTRSFSMPYGAQGKYVRILSLPGNNANGNNIISLAEVEVWGHGTLTNVARNPWAVASQSSTQAPATRANDGNTDPIYVDGSVTHTVPAVTNGTYWEVDLGSACILKEIWLFNRGDCCGERLSNVRVAVWRSTNEVYGTNLLAGSGSVAQGGTTNLTFSTPIEGDRVRISLINNTNNAGNTILSLTEVQLFGQEGPDLTAPVLVSVAGFSSNLVQVQFSEPVTPASATNLAHYEITGSGGSLRLNSATLSADGLVVTLVTERQTYGMTYTVTVNGVVDRAPAANVIAPNSQLAFTAAPYTLLNIGSPALVGAVTNVSGGFDLTAAGIGTTGTSDQFTFNAEPRTGDFDLKVRVASVGLANPWSRAGLMARASQMPDSPYLAVWATPNLSGCFCQWRPTAAASTSLAGSFPVNYPFTWLRLRRAGNTFTSFGSWDGQNWVPIAEVSLVLGTEILLGVAATSFDGANPITAQFRELGNASGLEPSRFEPTSERPGPSSRRTGLAITEIMYHPRSLAGGSNSLEFIELFNSQSIRVNLGGYRISGAVDYTFPLNTIIQPGAFLVVARAPAALQSYYGLTQVLGPWNGAETNGLPGDEGTLRLRNPQGAVLLDVHYRAAPPWPIAADGAGHSLVLARPSYGEGQAAAWAASDSIDGSPGRPDPVTPDPLRVVVINELLANSNLPREDYVELYNHSRQAVDLSGAWLSDDPNTNKFRVPDGTLLGPASFVYFTQTTLGFALSSGGERLYLVNSNQTRVIDTLEFEGQAPDVSLGRFPDGGRDFYLMATRTPGAPNGALRPAEVVINEIMYHPISGDNNEEYVELYNRSTQRMDLSYWKLLDGITFTFPAGTVLAPQGYLVVAKNLTNLLAHYPGVLNSNNTVGNYNGTLADGGERIALAMLTPNVITNASAVTTNWTYVVINEVTYGDGGRWGHWSDGGGSSLELTDPDSDNRRPDNWADSDETAKSAWTTVAYTGLMGETLGSSINDNLHIYLLGMGECLVDDVEVLVGTGPNQILNPGFEAGNVNWYFQGALDQSGIEAGGFTGAQCLHLRASARGDPGANKIRSATFATFTTQGNVTLRCKARWLRGWPELLLRLHGGAAEAFGRLPVPASLGTPGQPNSRRQANAGPAIFNVRHAPALPVALQNVVVTAQASDPQGLAALVLYYRVDPYYDYMVLPMTDDGTGDDAVAGDGVYSATVMGQGNGVGIAFYVQATDQLGGVNTFPKDLFPPPPLMRTFPCDSPARECLVRFGDPQMPGSFATYHLWMTSATSNRWYTRDNLSNAGLDVTFVYSDQRVVYNAEAMFSGSPFHRPLMTTGPSGVNRCDYIVRMPPDDLVLGESDFNLVIPGNGNGGANTCTDPSGLAEQSSYVLFEHLEIPWMYRRFIHLFVNGSQRSYVGNVPGNFICEDVQQPNRDLVRQWYPDDPDGELIKLDDWFEFNDAATSFSNNDADLQRRLLSDGGLNLAPYRYMWRKRSLGPGDSANDFTQFLELLNAVSPTTNTSAAVDFVRFNAVANVDQWMREFACQRTVGNFDSYGWNRGKNNYTYRPVHGRIEFLPWDVDWTMGTGIGQPYNAALFGSSDPRVVVMYATPEIRRLYLRYFKALVDGPLNNAVMDPILDERAAAMVANNVNYDLGTLNGIKAYVGARRGYLQSQLAGLTNAFGLTSAAAYATNVNLITLSGYGSVEIKDICINGTAFPVTWLATYTNWTLRVPLNPGTNLLLIQGLDWQGNLLPYATATNTITYTGPTVVPQGLVVINEIMYHPAIPDAEFIEIFNAATNFHFDLSGWRLNGLDYTFPAGTVLSPRSFLVLAKDRNAFANAYGLGTSVYDVFPGNLDAEGETLTLLKPSAPGLLPPAEEVVAKVRYEPQWPWPVLANGRGGSLQLIDPTQDPARVVNWSDGAGWRYYSYTGVSSQRRFLIFPDTAGDIYLDDLLLVPGSVPGVGPNLILNGDFEGPLTTNGGGPWFFVSTNGINSTIDTNIAHSGRGSLHLIFTGAGGSAAYLGQDSLATSNATYTLSFWYLASTNVNKLTLRTSSSFRPEFNVKPVGATPAGTNAVALALSPLLPLWLNEAQPENITGPLDNAGQNDPWVEVYNAGANPIDLGGWFLTDTYSNLTQWAFPTGAVIGPGQFLVVWTDGEPAQSEGTNLHANFRLSSRSGSIALVALLNNGPQVLDYLNYTNLLPDRAYGACPDGQPFTRQNIYYFTPGTPNNPTSAPLAVVINEWMADNVHTLADPANDRYEDWFELYNPSTHLVDLSGCFLTDNLNNRTQYRVPAGFTVPPQGFLLVWADGSPGENNLTARPDLHVNFQLSRNGEAIALFAPDGRLVDQVRFGYQAGDTTEGRYPDGTGPVCPMARPTPWAANEALVVATNHSPELGLLPNRTVALGQTLSFTVTATDSDTPAQTLTFSLETGAPTGAALDPATGLFSWTPAQGQGPGTVMVTIKVRDNGSPPLEAVGSFLVTVTAANTAPVLGALNNRAVLLGQSVSFAITATDAEAPPQTLTFNLDQAPAGATLHPANGQFHWIPTTAQAPSTNLITVRVMDNGTPSLGATNSFMVLVGLPPRFANGQALRQGTQILLSFGTLPGKTYQVQYKDRLSDSAWTPLAPPQTATNLTLTLSDSLLPRQQRYYRITVGD